MGMARLVAGLIVLFGLIATLVLPAMAQYGSCNYWVVYGYGYPAQLVRGPYCSYWDCQNAASFFNQHYMEYNYQCQQVF